MKPNANELAEAAARYAEHSEGCSVCGGWNTELCDAGLELLKDFQTALHASLLPPDYDA